MRHWLLVPKNFISGIDNESGRFCKKFDCINQAIKLILMVCSLFLFLFTLITRPYSIRMPSKAIFHIFWMDKMSTGTLVKIYILKILSPHAQHSTSTTLNRQLKTCRFSCCVNIQFFFFFRIKINRNKSRWIETWDIDFFFCSFIRRFETFVQTKSKIIWNVISISIGRHGSPCIVWNWIVTVLAISHLISLDMRES